jgi:hypothetical protein
MAVNQNLEIWLAVSPALVIGFIQSAAGEADKLFMAQGEHGINPHRSPRRDVAREGSDTAQQNRDASESPRVEGPHAVEQTLQVMGKARRHAKTNHNADRRKHKSQPGRQP